MRDVLILLYVLLAAVIGWQLAEFVRKPVRIRLAGCWLGSRVIAFGYAVEDFKDTFGSKKKKLAFDMGKL